MFINIYSVLKTQLLGIGMKAWIIEAECIEALYGQPQLLWGRDK